MRSALLKLLIIVPFVFCLSNRPCAQNGFSTGLNGTVINLSCNQNCITTPFQVPHIKTPSDYILRTIPYNPYSFDVATSTELPNIYMDDRYSPIIDMPFPFCFYDSLFSKCVAGSNGLITFDIANANCGNSWQMTQQIPYVSNNICSADAPYYPKSSIMAAFTDLLPTAIACPPDRKIAWHVEGTAPSRRFILNYYHVGMFGGGNYSAGGTNCNSQNPSTFQIVLYEALGVVEIYIERKMCNSSGQGANTIMAIQNWPRDKYVVAPGKNAQVWVESNTGYRFLPSAAASRFVSCELQTFAGTTIAVGDTITTTAGVLDVTFPNFCQSISNNKYIIKTTYNACDANGPVVIRDTITVNKTASLNATVAVTPTACGLTGTGTATATVPAGVGTPPYTYVLNPGNISQTNNQFTGLTAGNYTITVTDAGTDGCTSVLPLTIAANGVLTVTYSVTNTTCVGPSNGSITVNPPNGTPPITYSINGGLFTTNNVFSNLAPGTYFISTRDAAGCAKDFDPVIVGQGNALTMTTSVTPSSCTGANNGSITVTAINGGGTPPYQYSINGGPFQASNTFNNLVGSTAAYFISVIDAVGCTITNSPVVVPVGTSNVGGSAQGFPTACAGVNNGSVVVNAVGAGPFQYSLNNGPYQTSNVFNNLAPGNYTVVIREGGQCTSAPISAIVTSGSGIQATATPTGTSCAAASNGVVQVSTPINGTAPYTFVLDGTTTQIGNSANFTNVPAGNHSVTITDAAGCTTAAPLTAIVSAGAGFTATYTSVNSTCTGATNGSITVNPSTNGTAPFTFMLGATTLTGTTATFNNLASGTYSIQITDANGCQFTLSNATVTASAGFTAGYSSTNSSCAGASNGSITVNPSASGTAPFTFVLGTTTLTGPTATFNNLAAGSYNVQITDANGCQFTLSNATVTASAGFTAGYNSTNSSCTGATNGSITVTPGVGGTAPYTFVLGTTTLTGPTATFNNLAAGTYSVQITDAIGCQFTLSNAIVTAGAGFTAGYNAVNSSCTGATNGSITVTPGAGGTAPYTFVLGTTTLTGPTATFNNLAAGTYSVQITDAIGCQFTLSNAIVTAGAGFTAGYNSTNTSCASATNGSITVNPGTGGTAPYTFVLGTTTLTGPTATFNNLAAGTYSVQITDAIGCQFTLSNAIITANTIFTVTPASVTTSCPTAANGSLTLTPGTGGTGPYTFVLNGTITQTGATNTTFTGLLANTYSVVVTDAVGCTTAPISATVNPGPAITVTPAKTDATCFGLPTGSINAVASANATAPVEFSLDNTNWQTNPGFTGLTANTYTVFIRDAVGCTNSATITVGQPAPLTITPTAQGVSCNGLSDGKVTANVAGGTPNYTYSLDNTTFQASNVFAVPAGTYTLYTRDANNCSAQSGSFVVTEPAILTATAISGNASCDGGNDGTINVTPTGGTAPYQYAITGGTYQPSSTLTTAPGTYDVSVRDANGCIYQVPGVVVGLSNNLTFTPAADPAPICEGSSVQLQLTTNATQFSWTPAADLSNPGIINPVASPKTTTPYTVTMTLGRCSLTDDITVTVLPAPIANGGTPGHVCYGQSYQLQAVGDPSFTYTWSPSTYLSSTTGYTVTSVLPQRTIVYKLSVTDNNGCQSLTPAEVEVKVDQPMKVDVSPVDTVVYPGVQIPLIAKVPGGDPTDLTYTWSPATGLNNPNVPGPIATAPLFEGDVAIYHVTASTSAGCRGEADITIRVYKGPDLYVPNAFTPNGDSRNDEFIPFPVGIKQLNYFRVFNRWGQMVFSTTTLNKGWDGKIGGMEQTTGVYTWVAEAVTMDNRKISKRGVVTLIR